MYLALKWLIVLTFAMWIALCGIDVIFRAGKKKYLKYTDLRTNTHESIPKPSDAYYKNFTYNRQPAHGARRSTLDKLKRYQPSDTLTLYLTFIAGALCITVYNQRAEILHLAVHKLNVINKNLQSYKKQLSKKNLLPEWNETAKKTWVATVKLSTLSWRMAKVIYKSFKHICAIIKGKGTQDEDDLKIRLLSKLKILGDERHQLGQLLIAAIEENKHIRVQYQLESLAKCRLYRHLEEMKKEIKKFRSKYISLQQCYLVTHEENMFLKARVEKVIVERDEADRTLRFLMEEVQKSSDIKLRALGDYLAQVRAQTAMYSTSSTCLLKSHSSPTSDRRSISPVVSVEDGELITYEGEEDIPKLRGLPGEYVWTVKDRDGVIEKLYQYDYSQDHGDIIRRIREYTVYHDKDCLLDFAQSGTVVQEVPKMSEIPINNEPASTCQAQPVKISSQVRIVEKSTVSVVTTANRANEQAVNVNRNNIRTESKYQHIKTDTANRATVRCCQIRPPNIPRSPAPGRFLTDSVAFKAFLKNNNNIVATPSPMSRRSWLRV